NNDPSALPWSVLGVTFLGIFLIGCLYMALGCFASALTRSQIVAAMISYAFGLTIFILSLRSIIPGASIGWRAQLFSQLSMISHMEEFARGIIDTRAMV